jgi:4-carboxymuconolactone decarboxylase
MTNYPDSPREAARRFTPELTELINDPLYSKVWTDPRLSPRDRSIATLAALIAAETLL